MARDLSFDTGVSPAPDRAAEQVQNALAWEAPRLPQLRSSIPRWGAAASWAPPGTIPLVRHRAVAGGHRIVTTDRRAPAGYEIEYDLGVVHQHAQPGTSRLLSTPADFATTSFEGTPDDGIHALGWIENAALPMTYALEVRRLADGGALVLTAGPADPLIATSHAVRTLGFVEGFPIEPRERPHQVAERSFGILTRTTDLTRWRHRYDVLPPGAPAPDAHGVVALGGVLLEPRPHYGAVRLRADGTLSTPGLASGVARGALADQAKWAFAPLRWDARRVPHTWAAKAAGGRMRHALTARGGAGQERLFCHLRSEPRAGWAPLYAAHHPALKDQFVTRSELEATDLGYVVDGILGYTLLRLGQNEGLPAPAEIPWGSRFGQQRRYVDGPA